MLPGVAGVQSKWSGFVSKNASFAPVTIIEGVIAEREQVKNQFVFAAFWTFIFELENFWVWEHGPNLLCTYTNPFSSVTGDLCHSNCQEDNSLLCFRVCNLICKLFSASVLLQVIKPKVLCNDIDRFGKIKKDLTIRLVADKVRGAVYAIKIDVVSLSYFQKALSVLPLIWHFAFFFPEKQLKIE